MGAKATALDKPTLELGTADDRSKQTQPVRHLLFVLVAAVTVPLVVVAFLAFLDSAANDRLGEEDQLLDVARTAAASIDREFAMAEAFLKGLGVSPSLSSDLNRFEVEARNAAPAGTYVALYDQDGRQLVNTFLEPGGLADRTVISGNVEHLKRTLEAGRILISGVFIGATSRVPMVMVSKPVLDPSNAPRVLSLVLPASRLAAIYAERDIAAGWVAAVLDQQRITAARTRNPERIVGRPATPPVIAALASKPSGVLRNVRTADGVPAVIAYARAPLSNYATAVAIPDAFFTVKLWRTLLPLGAGTGALLIAALAIATVMSRRVLAATERIFAQSEKRMRQRLRELEGVYDNAPIGLALLDRDLRYLRINAELARSNGTPAREHLGRAVFDVLPHLRAVLEPVLGKVLLGETLRDHEFVGRHAAHGGRTTVWRGHYYPIRDDREAVVAIGVVAEDITARKKAEDIQRLLMHELHHRVQNVLATVQAVIRSTARSVSDLDDYQRSLATRITSLSQTHSLLIDGRWRGAALHDLLSNELAPYNQAAKSRIAVEGPAVTIPPDSAVTFGMAIHELTTNAAKHGALSLTDGRVSVRWRLERLEDGGQGLDFHWVESGGPPVHPPARQGFGSRLLRDVLVKQLGAKMEMDFVRSGLVLHLRLRIDAVEETPFASAGEEILAGA